MKVVEVTFNNGRVGYAVEITGGCFISEVGKDKFSSPENILKYCMFETIEGAKTKLASLVKLQELKIVEVRSV